MRIVHIAPNSPYNEGWGYQENLLTKYQVKCGNEVTLIIRNEKHSEKKIIKTEIENYISKDGFRVIRKESHGGIWRLNFLEKMDVYELLQELKPDYIFFHGLINRAILDATKYKKEINPNCIIVEDNHMDYNIGYQCKKIKEKIIRNYYRMINKKSIKYVSKVYGVTPWRKTYAEDYFGIPSNKTDVLIMGADDEKMHLDKKEELREQVRKQYHISERDFLIVTGGKIDKKKKIDTLMEACVNLPNVKLLVFGNVADDVRYKFEQLKENENIIYIGWIDSDKVYEYFYAADLVFFPGQHSVLWEQACASKVPCVFEKWEGMDHVNNGGNSDFISPVTIDTIKDKIEELKFTPIYYKMKEVAESDKTDIYLYSKIAEKSLECAIE